MAKYLWAISGIGFLIVVGIFFIIAFDIEINSTQITILTFIAIIGIAIVAIIKVFNVKAFKGWFSGSTISSKDMEKAENVAREYWRNRRNEELDYNESHGLERTFGDDMVYGFNFYRVDRGAEKAGFPVVILVRSNPMRVVRWNDHPTPEEQDNPYVMWGAGFTGTPVKGLAPSMDASFHKRGADARDRSLVTINPPTTDDFFSGKKEK